MDITLPFLITIVILAVVSRMRVSNNLYSQLGFVLSAFYFGILFWVAAHTLVDVQVIISSYQKGWAAAGNNIFFHSLLLSPLLLVGFGFSLAGWLKARKQGKLTLEARLLPWALAAAVLLHFVSGSV